MAQLGRSDFDLINCGRFVGAACVVLQSGSIRKTSISVVRMKIHFTGLMSMVLTETIAHITHMKRTRKTDGVATNDFRTSHWSGIAAGWLRMSRFGGSTFHDAKPMRRTGSSRTGGPAKISARE